MILRLSVGFISCVISYVGEMIPNITFASWLS